MKFLKHSLLIGAMCTFLSNVHAQGAPPEKQRSNSTFTQADDYLNVKKRIGIPAGTLETLNGLPGAPAYLYFRTDSNTLKVYNPVTSKWVNAVPLPASTGGKFIQASPSIPQVANISLIGSVVAMSNDGSRGLAINSGLVNFFGSSGGGQIGVDGYNTSTPNGTIAITPGAVNVTANASNSFEATRNYLRLKAAGVEWNLLRPVSATNILNRAPSRNGTLATLEDITDSLKKVSGSGSIATGKGLSINPTTKAVQLGGTYNSDESININPPGRIGGALSISTRDAGMTVYNNDSFNDFAYFGALDRNIILRYRRPDFKEQSIVIGETSAGDGSREMVVIDKINGIGLGDKADYSAGKTAYSYVTKMMLDAVTSVEEYADNDAAIAAGLPVGKLYRTGDIVKIVHTPNL